MKDVAAVVMRTRPLTGTCRLQLHAQFPLSRAAEVVAYLDRLGVSHVYASPILAARPGSMHGYDVADFARVNPELGGDDARRALVAALRDRGMGLLLDIVPNHMGTGASNPYWDDVLTHGRDSRWAHLFDIDWSPTSRALHGKVLLPVLGDELDAVLARGELTVQRGDGPPRLAYFDKTFPLAPATRDLPVQGADALRTLLARQHYVLAYWKKGAREVNYRRFFDVDELVALRAEDAATREATHALPLRWIADGELDGLRIDHVDGLRDPAAYLRWLREQVEGGAPAEASPVPIFVEKILSPGERLRASWPVQGTTGYEFLNDLEAVFIDPVGAAAVEQGYRRLLRLRPDSPGFAEVAIRGKLRILRGPLRPDVDRLARLLAPVALLDPRGAAVGRRELGEAIVQLLAAMPVYRTYVDAAGDVVPEDAAVVERALARALDRAAAPAGTLRLVADTLLLRAGATAADRVAGVAFAQRFQQVSGPATAKGVEDTALYLYFPLASRNEVGGEPDRDLADAVGSFHRAGAGRAVEWPLALLSTNTHDTKRSADVRARIDVLSEMPEQWLAAVARWRRMLAPLRTRVGTRSTPDANGEYLFLQTVVGTWPPEHAGRVPGAPALVALADRVRAYMLKAAREGKTVTSWTEPDAAWEQALEDYVRGAFDPGRGAEWLADVARFTGEVARPGLWNSLARVVLHFAAPGTPDLYQGDDLWNFALVDPDNRRPVDWAARDTMLARIEGATTEAARTALLADAVATPEDGLLKLWLTRALLHARRDRPALFRQGGYLALTAEGSRAAHVVAFARQRGEEAALVVAPRLGVSLGGGRSAPLGAAWQDTVLRLPAGLVSERWRCVLTGRVSSWADGGRLALSALLADTPVGCWVAGPGG